MGLFHCPLGSAFYDDEPCIDCKLCLAKTKEEMLEATTKLREYLRTQAPPPGPVKKIAVSGKGGTGKSTVVSIIAKILAGEDYRVIVIDTDESNPGLYRLFHFDKEPRPLISLMSRFSEGQPAPNTEWITREQITLEDIPEEYITSHGNIHFLIVGKIENPFQGCACSIYDVTRDLMSKFTLRNKDIILVDLEAGVESFGRGMERNVDTVLVIVEPSFESMTLAVKIVYMAEGMGIIRVRAILNKVPSEETRQKMGDMLSKNNVKIIGSVYYDPEVSEAGFAGTEPDDSQAIDDLKVIVRDLLNE